MSKMLARQGTIGALCLTLLAACLPTHHQRTLYDQPGIQVGVESDLSANERTHPSIVNRHPADISPRDMRALLGSLQVSAWSGTMLGLVLNPVPRPVFTDAERSELAEPLAEAFHAAGPRERVFFSLANPTASYDQDRTAGSLFFRDEYLHVILTDHYAFLQADPGGGEKRDPRDTKGMKLWLARPAQEASLPEAKEPIWSPFETVHISFKPADVLAATKAPETAAGSSIIPKTPMQATGLPAAAQAPPASAAADRDGDLRLQLRELTDANQDLRAQLKEQSAMLEKLKADLKRLQGKSRAGKAKPPSAKPTPSPQSVQ